MGQGYIYIYIAGDKTLLQKQKPTHIVSFPRPPLSITISLNLNYTIPLRTHLIYQFDFDLPKDPIVQKWFWNLTASLSHLPLPKGKGAQPHLSWHGQAG